MNAYSIEVNNGKIIGDSTFFRIANDLLHKECKRLCDFTEALDKDPAVKKERISEYKCAKYRYADVSLIHSIVWNNNHFRKARNLESSHYLLLPFDSMLKERMEYMDLYESAPANEKPDYSLYYAVLTFIARERQQLEEKLPHATDWEKIELEERIGGLRFAQECLDEAWQKRKDGME